MKSTILASILIAVFTFNVSQAQQNEQDASAENADEVNKEQKWGKRHHRRHGHHREKIHRMMMQKADTNDDGKVDLNEYLQNAQQRFESMDADADGFVTGDEMRAAGKAMRKKHKEAMKAARKSYEESVEDSE